MTRRAPKDPPRVASVFGVDLALPAGTVAGILVDLGLPGASDFVRAVPTLTARGSLMARWKRAIADVGAAMAHDEVRGETDAARARREALSAVAEAVDVVVRARESQLRGVEPNVYGELVPVLKRIHFWRSKCPGARGNPAPGAGCAMAGTSTRAGSVAARRAPAPWSPRANPVRSIANVATEKRGDGHYYRDVREHLIGPFATKALAEQEGVLALAAALAPGVPRRDLFELAATLASEDRAKAHAKRFSDGWRVWKPAVGRYVGGEGGAPFATRAEADAAVFAASGRRVREAPLLGRTLGPERPASAPPTQLGLFGGARANPATLAPLRGSHGEAVTYRVREDGTVIVRASHPGAGMSEREMDVEGAARHRAKLLGMGYRPNPAGRSNPSVTRNVPATLSFGADAHGTFTVRGRSVRGDVWEYVDVFDAHGTPMGGGAAITAFAPSGVGPLWLLPDDGREAVPPRAHRARGVVYPQARWRDGDAEGGVVEVLSARAPRPNGTRAPRAALPVGVVRWTWVAPVHLDGALLREMQAQGFVYGQPFALAGISEALGGDVVASAAQVLSAGATREIDEVELPGGLAVNDWNDAELTVERLDTRPGGLAGATDTARLVLDLRPALYRPNPAPRRRRVR